MDLINRMLRHFRATPARILFPRRPKEHAEEILRSLQSYDLESLRTRFPNSNWHKYLNIQKFVHASVTICEKTGLIGAKPQRILESFYGPGYRAERSVIKTKTRNVNWRFLLKPAVAPRCRQAVGFANARIARPGSGNPRVP